MPQGHAMIREAAMEIEWSDTAEEVQKLRSFIEQQFSKQEKLLCQLFSQLQRSYRSETEKFKAWDHYKEEAFSPSLQILHASKNGDHPLEKETSPELSQAVSPQLSRSGQSEIIEAGVSPKLSTKSGGEEINETEDSKFATVRKLHHQASLGTDSIERDVALINWSSPKSIAHYITCHPIFIYGIMFIILFNLVSLGFEVDIAARVGAQDVPKWFDYMNLIVVCIFVLELGVNVTANGCWKFACGSDKIWNFFDLVIVAVSVVETAVNFFANSASASQVSPQHLRFMRPIRLFRALRGVRVMRLFRYVGALRTLLLSIMSSIASLFWTIVLLLLLFYSFGVLLTQLVSDHCRYIAIDATGDPNASPQCSELEYSTYWSSVPESMLTLFMAISGGIDWDDGLRPLRTVSPVAVGALVLYIIITVFTVVNVVTGVFCNTAIESAAADKDIAVMKQMNKHAAQVQVLRHVFKEIDGKSQNAISMSDFEEAMAMHKLSSFFESMGISTQDVWTLFKVIDADGSGTIDMEEFVTGCMRFHGPAKSLDVAKMAFENEITRDAIKELDLTLSEIKEQLEAISKNATASPMTRRTTTRSNNGSPGFQV